MSKFKFLFRFFVSTIYHCIPDNLVIFAIDCPSTTIIIWGRKQSFPESNLMRRSKEWRKYLKVPLVHNFHYILQPDCTILNQKGTNIKHIEVSRPKAQFFWRAITSFQYCFILESIEILSYAMLTLVFSNC